MEDALKKCVGCGAEMPSYQNVCSDCGRRQPQVDYSLSSDGIKVYMTLEDVAKAIIRQEDRFYVAGEILQYDALVTKKYFTKAIISMAVILLIALIAVDFSIEMICLLIAFVVIGLIVTDLSKHKKSKVLFMKLFVELGPNSTTKYWFKQLKDGRVLVRRTFMAQHSIITNVSIVALVILVILLMLHFQLGIG